MKRFSVLFPRRKRKQDNIPQWKKRKVKYWGLHLKNIRKKQEEEHYIISRGDVKILKELKYWRQLEYYQLLEQIIAEAERKKKK